MILSTGGEGAAEFQEDEDAAEHTDEGGGGGDGPMLIEDLKCMLIPVRDSIPSIWKKMIYVVILSEKSSSSMRPSSSSSEMSE